jgi:hypothetical protein
MLRVCSIALLAITFSSPAGGQKQICKLGTARFACPAKMKRLEIDPSQNYQIFLKKDVALFVALPKTGLSDAEFVNEIAKVALLRLFPRTSQNFAWKDLKYDKPVSKFETGSGTVQGFNGSKGVLVKYRHLKTTSAEVLIGYVADFGEGKEAREVFDRNLGADTIATLDGCSASVEVIYSITHEKLDPNNSPCSLDVTAG